MTREQFISDLTVVDDVEYDEPFSDSAQRIADYDKEQREEIETLKALIEELKRHAH